MFENILANNTFLEKAGLILIFFVCFSLFILLISRLSKKKAIKLSFLGSTFEIQPDGLAADGTHGICIDPVALVEIYNMTTNTAGMVSVLKTKQILSDQMNYLEDKAIIIREALISSYRKCLSDNSKKEDGSLASTVVSSKEYQFFNSLITLMVEDQKKTCRQIFIKNNFSNLGEREFQEYLEEKVTLLQTKARLYVRELYPSDKMEIPFELLEQEVFNKTAEVLVKNYEQVFRRAAQIYRTKHEEADTLDSDLRAYIKATYGADVEAPYKVIERAQGGVQK
jgi:hypothetical protein